MKTKEILNTTGIEVLRKITSEIRDVDCYMTPDEIKTELHDIATKIYNMTLVNPLTL